MQPAASYLPVDLARGTAAMFTDTGSGGTYARLAESGNEPVTFVVDLRCRAPHPEEVKRFGKTHRSSKCPFREVWIMIAW